MQKIMLFILPLALASCDSPEDEEFLAAEDEAEAVDLADAEFANPEEDPEALYACGLDKTYYGSFWAYSVVNCHPYPVSRRVVFDDGNPGACRFYGTGYPSNMFDGTAKRQPMYLIGC